MALVAFPAPPVRRFPAEEGAMTLHPRFSGLALSCLACGLALTACNKPIDTTASGEAEGEAAAADVGEPDADPAGEAEAGEATGDAAAQAEPAADGGKSANPARPGEGPPQPMVTWDEAPLELGFPTGDAKVFFGQGMCMPRPACQELKIVKGDKDKPLTSCADVAKVIVILEEKDQALARARFCTDHRYVLDDERCTEVEVSADGAVDIQLPKDLDLEASPVSTPVKVVDFEGGFRVERTLLCMGDEADKLVKVAETVFTEGHMEREEVEVLLEAPGLVPRLR